jgi:hypothetical protein
MVLDPKLLGNAQAAEQRLATAERLVEGARSDLNKEVRRMRAAGGTLREVAAALGLSEQRVRQTVNGGGRDRPQRTMGDPGDNTVSCAFCGRPNDEVDHMLAGNEAYVCSDCVPVATEVLTSQVARQTTPNTIIAPMSGADSFTRCRFCGRHRPSKSVVVGEREFRPAICAGCLADGAEALVDLVSESAWKTLAGGGKVLT